MKIYGYDKNQEDLLELSEVTVQADPKLLRELASFINKCADSIEREADWEHEHFSAVYCKKDELETDFIIYRNE